MSDDITTLLDDEEEDSEPTPRDNAAQAKARLDREKTKLRKELEELQAWKAEREKADRDKAVAAALKEAGVDMRAVQFYEELRNADDPAEALPVLKQKYLAEDEREATLDAAAGFTPTVFEEGTTPAMKRYTRKEFEDIMRENPERGRALYEAGKVKWNNS